MLNVFPSKHEQTTLIFYIGQEKDWRNQQQEYKHEVRVFKNWNNVRYNLNKTSAFCFSVKETCIYEVVQSLLPNLLTHF